MLSGMDVSSAVFLYFWKLPPKGNYFKTNVQFGFIASEDTDPSRMELCSSFQSRVRWVQCRLSGGKRSTFPSGYIQDSEGCWCCQVSEMVLCWLAVCPHPLSKHVFLCALHFLPKQTLAHGTTGQRQHSPPRRAAPPRPEVLTQRTQLSHQGWLCCSKDFFLRWVLGVLFFSLCSIFLISLPISFVQ